MSVSRLVGVMLALCLFGYIKGNELSIGSKDLPEVGEVLRSYNEDEVRERLDNMDLQHVEGLWSYPHEQMIVVVERYESSKLSKKIDYRMVMVSSEDLSLLPGTVIGYMESSAVHNKYRLWIYSEKNGATLRNPQKCVATIDEGERK